MWFMDACRPPSQSRSRSVSMCQVPSATSNPPYSVEVFLMVSTFQVSKHGPDCVCLSRQSSRPSRPSRPRAEGRQHQQQPVLFGYPRDRCSAQLPLRRRSANAFHAFQHSTSTDPPQEMDWKMRQQKREAISGRYLGPLDHFRKYYCSAATYSAARTTLP